jgi:hypothetical protein
MDASNASWILDGMAGALSQHMYNNYYPQASRLARTLLGTTVCGGASCLRIAPTLSVQLGGGGIEQAGAVEAINTLLLQGQEGFLRFFPVWPVGEAASFTTLRTQGALVCRVVVLCASQQTHLCMTPALVMFQGHSLYQQPFQRLELSLQSLSSVKQAQTVPSLAPLALECRWLRMCRLACLYL